MSSDRLNLIGSDSKELNSDSDSDDNKGYYDQILKDPLSLIDQGANLEDVLGAKTIGEAMQILCPNIPGFFKKIIHHIFLLCG